MSNETLSLELASKYSSIVDERFNLKSLTDNAVNNDYDFIGVNAVKVYSVDTAEVVDYDRNGGTSRYGSVAELGNDAQEMRLTQDKCFTFSIDRGNLEDTEMANSAANALRRQIDEVITPMIDKYRLAKLCANAGTYLPQDISSVLGTDSNAYQCFLDASMQLTDELVPMDGRVSFVTTEYFKKIKMDKHFTGTGNAAAEIAAGKEVGYIDGTPIIVTPSSYLPNGVNFIITHKSAMCSPVKIAEYKTHSQPQGISGWLCEGRVFYDAFVLNNKQIGVLVSHKPVTLASLAIGSLTLAPTFDLDEDTYTTTTTNASNTITAAATDSSATAEIKNGSTVITNGSAATWATGDNTVTVKVSNGVASKTYTVTVTKS